VVLFRIGGIDVYDEIRFLRLGSFCRATGVPAVVCRHRRVLAAPWSPSAAPRLEALMGRVDGAHRGAWVA
jgi:hypothetical protein